MTDIRVDEPRFPVGQFVITSNAASRLTDDDVTSAIRRHVQGDWGEVCEEDRLENDRSLIEGSRLLSVYDAQDGLRFWIITEADRSVTTVLLPEDY